MPTTKLPDIKEEAAEISRKIANSRPSTRDKSAPQDQVSGGFNQKSHAEPLPASAGGGDENSATDGDGQ